MADRKRPRRTRERILETALALFNRHGEPSVTTAHVADEMNISPGNLYYHFRNKDEIIGELYAAYESEVLPLFGVPPDRAAGRNRAAVGRRVLPSRSIFSSPTRGLPRRPL